jgi:hypothetical protein
MLKYFVHDFLIEETGVNGLEGCIFYHISAYCTHKKDWVEQDSEKFFVSVGNPIGIARHLDILQQTFIKSNHKNFFDGPFMVISNYEEKEVLKMIKEKIESISGSTKSEVLFKLSPYFEWEYLSEPQLVTGVFK